MTRFELELNGNFGEFWKKNALKEIENRKEEYKNGELLINENGVATWKANGSAVPEEIALMAKFGGLPISLTATAQFREEQNKRFIEEYREQMKNHKHTEEELSEMRAAFGMDTEVVDIITGQRIKL